MSGIDEGELIEIAKRFRKLEEESEDIVKRFYEDLEMERENTALETALKACREDMNRLADFIRGTK